MEYGLEEMTGFSMISDAQHDNLVECFISDNGTLVGYSVVSGHLRSLGVRVQRNRIRESIARVDPGNSRIRWAVVISRRAYSVAGPKSVWHINRHHSLVSWGFVIHGGIDGFNRLMVFLKCSTRNRSDTFLGKARWELGANDAQTECAENDNEYCTVLNKYLDRECERI